MNENSVALLPTRTNINPSAPEGEHFTEGRDELLVLENKDGKRTVAASAGMADDLELGATFEAHHDQQGYTFGTLKVVGVRHLDGTLEGDVPGRKLSLRVFK